MDRGWVGNGCGPNRRMGHGYDTNKKYQDSRQHTGSYPQQVRRVWLCHPEQLCWPRSATRTSRSKSDGIPNVGGMQEQSNHPTSTNLLSTVHQLDCTSRCMSTSSNDTTSSEPCTLSINETNLLESMVTNDNDMSRL